MPMIRIEEEEKFPHYILIDDEWLIPLEIPQEKLDWILKTISEFEEVQAYLGNLYDEYFEKQYKKLDEDDSKCVS